MQRDKALIERTPWAIEAFILRNKRHRAWYKAVRPVLRRLPSKRERQAAKRALRGEV